MFRGFVVNAFHEGMAGEEFSEATAQGAGAVSVDDADGGLGIEGGVVEEFVNASGGFFDGEADDVDFVERRGRSSRS
jgi:hypothetical protein